MSKDPCLFIQKISIFLLYHIFPVCVKNKICSSQKMYHLIFSIKILISQNSVAILSFFKLTKARNKLLIMNNSMNSA